MDRAGIAYIGCVAAACAAVGAMLVTAGALPEPGRGLPPSFVNWETPHVHPIDMTPDGALLLVVNTPDNRLEVFNLTGAAPTLVSSIPVGLDPVSVRARSNTEVWVVNHISDSVSVVDLTTENVVATLRTKDEPCDVVFAGAPLRAFVSCSQANKVQVFDPADVAAAPQEIAINAEDPRALAVSPDGATVYAAVFESGNASTVIGGSALEGANNRLVFPPNVVNEPGGPYGGVNPPPNAGASFDPPIAGGLPTPPKVSLIVKKDAQGRWMDDNGGDWTDLVSGPNADLSGRPVGWDLPDRDLAVIDASTLSVQYATGLMNNCMALGVNPATGDVAVVGIDGTNEVRFEPVVNGRFIRVNLALVDPGTLAKSITDLNPQLDYSTGYFPDQSDRDRAVGDPRAIVWNAAGTLGFITGMGSDNVILVDAAGNRTGPTHGIGVGEGPTGLALDEARGRLYVLNKFDASVSVVDLSTEAETDRIAFYDPSPVAIKLGRRHLYNTHETSGLGYVSCASCHVDARMDRLAWDLGDPQGEMKTLAGLNLGAGILGLRPGTTQPAFQPFHPMKGPMTTQTLQDIIGHEPFHWRGDRLGLEEFNGAFMGLLGDDETLTPVEMQEFEDFLATIHFPPNPFRNIDNTLPANLPLPGHYKTGRFGPAGEPLPSGNAQNGLALYTSLSRRLDAGALACVTCHTLPTGAGTGMTFNAQQNRFVPIPPGPMGEAHHMLVSVDGTTNISTKVPQLRNAYEKVGFDCTQIENVAGFGFLKDGSVDSLARFVNEPVFNVASDQETADLVAFMLALSGSDLPAGVPTNQLLPPGTPSKDTHAAVGWQVTIASSSSPQAALIDFMLSMAADERIGVVVKGRVGGQQRGFVYQGGDFQSDRQDEVYTPEALLALTAPGSELTYTVVPFGTQTRIGVDRDTDGWLDADERSVCADPADPSHYPGSPGSIDANGDLALSVADFTAFRTAYLQGDPRGDFNGDGAMNVGDFTAFRNAYLAGCP